MDLKGAIPSQITGAFLDNLDTSRNDSVKPQLCCNFFAYETVKRPDYWVTPHYILGQVERSFNRDTCTKT